MSNNFITIFVSELFIIMLYVSYRTEIPTTPAMLPTNRDEPSYSRILNHLADELRQIEPI